MPILKQVLVTAVVLAAGFWGLVTFFPASHPVLDRFGLLAPFGISVPEAATGADAGRQSGGAGRGSGGAVAVIAAPATEANLFDQITTIGDGRAIRSVTLVSEVSGNLSVINVQSGSFVRAGDVLASLEDAVQQIELERAQFLLQDAEEAAARIEALGTTVTKIQRSNAMLALRTAELDLKEAEFELARRQLVAPIAGWVGLVSYNVGDQISPSDVITQIDDRSRIVVEFRVPERFVGQIAEGAAIKATPLARPQLVLDGRVTAVDNRVDADSRTLRMQAALENTDDVLRPGMAFRINVSFTGEPFPAVDPLAIQWGSDGPFVWVVRDGKAARQKVMIMQRNSDSVLISGDLAVGELVVNEGVQNLRPGAEVEVRSSEDAGPAEASLSLTRG